MHAILLTVFISTSHWIKNIQNRLPNFKNSKQNNDDDIQNFNTDLI